MDLAAVILDVTGKMGDGPFRIVIVLVVFYGVRQLSKMRQSIEHLNTKIAVVVDRTMNHEKRIISLERKKK